MSTEDKTKIPMIEMYIKELKDSLKYIKKQYKDKSTELDEIEMELFAIITRAYKFQYCLNCDHKEKCLAPCYELVDGWKGLLVEDSELIKNSWKNRYG